MFYYTFLYVLFNFSMVMFCHFIHGKIIRHILRKQTETLFWISLAVFLHPVDIACTAVYRMAL